MKKLLAVIALAFAVGCTTPKPPPQPPPTPPPPPPPGPKFTEMLLRADGPRLINLSGAEVPFRGAISCCMENDWGGRSGWPFNAHPEWQDYAGTRGGANFFHARLGPFFGSPETEVQWSDIGGPYAQVPDGRADLGAWNPAFWDAVKDYVEYAGERGRYGEVVIIDGWYCKHGVWGDVQTPWMAQHNIQGEQWVGRCGKEAIAPGTVFDAWIKKVVSELGPYGNVIWQDGNEIALVSGYTPEWTVSMQKLVREYEASEAFNVVHMFGTNSGHPDAMAVADYVVFHTGGTPAGRPTMGKPTFVSEYNPRPPLQPEAWRMFNCLARESETFYWYWRHGQSLEQMEASLGYMPLGCEGVDTSGCPFDLPTLRRVKCGPIWDDAHYDCTPQICNSAYCRQAGWTDGRSCCAVRQEGDPTREACELKAMGGKIQWRFSEQSGGIAAIPFNDNFGLRIVGTGSLLAECYVASQPGKQMCIDGRTGGPLRISR